MEQMHEYKHGDLSGPLVVNLSNNQKIDDLCTEYIADYSTDRFEAIALRVFLGKETIITIYALDKTKTETVTEGHDKLPIKKFKLENVPLSALYNYVESLNFTISTGNYPLDEMEVINK